MLGRPHRSVPLSLLPRVRHKEEGMAPRALGGDPQQEEGRGGGPPAPVHPIGQLQQTHLRFQALLRTLRQYSHLLRQPGAAAQGRPASAQSSRPGDSPAGAPPRARPHCEDAGGSLQRPRWGDRAQLTFPVATSRAGSALSVAPAPILGFSMGLSLYWPCPAPRVRQGGSLHRAEAGATHRSSLPLSGSRS